MNRPRVTWKTATSLDGRIALASGESKWITGPEARRQVHLLRSQHDAILSGIGTVLADNPLFSVRLDGFVRTQPRRIIFDTHDRMPPDARLLNDTAGGAVTVCTVHSQGTPGGVRRQFSARDGRVDPIAVLDWLASDGVSTVMLECGSTLAASFLKLDLIDRIEWFRAPFFIGGSGRPVIDDIGLTSLGEAAAFSLSQSRQVGADRHETYVRVRGAES